MEIILLIAALAATPLGAAMLNKPTRNRAVKYVRAHKRRSKTLTEFVALMPRNKDWGPDRDLQQMWDEAFAWYQIRNREEVLRWAMEKQESYLKESAPLEEERGVLKIEMEHYAASGHGYSSVRAKHDEISRLNRELSVIRREFARALSSDEKTVLGLYTKYGRDVQYGNDLIRLAAKPVLPQLDYVALTAYTSK